MPYRLSFLLLLLLSLNATLNGQQTTATKIREALATSDCANVEGAQIKICKYDYLSNGLTPINVKLRVSDYIVQRVREPMNPPFTTICLLPFSV